MSTSKPTPAELMEAAVEAALPQRTQRRSMAVNFPDDLYVLVMDAARARDITMAAFLRRAAVAFAVYDQDLDWDDVMATEPGIRTFTASGSSESLAGKGRGPWRIQGLRE